MTLSREGEEEATWALGVVGEDGVWAGSFHTGNRTGAGYSLLVRDDGGQEAGLGDVALGEVREGLGVTRLRCGGAGVALLRPVQHGVDHQRCAARPPGDRHGRGQLPGPQAHQGGAEPRHPAAHRAARLRHPGACYLVTHCALRTLSTAR